MTSPYLERPLRSELDVIACERDHYREVLVELIIVATASTKTIQYVLIDGEEMKMGELRAFVRNARIVIRRAEATLMRSPTKKTPTETDPAGA